MATAPQKGDTLVLQPIGEHSRLSAATEFSHSIISCHSKPNRRGLQAIGHACSYRGKKGKSVICGGKGEAIDQNVVMPDRSRNGRD
jgi:hypothetical protein